MTAATKPAASRILLVEDDVDHRSILAEILGEVGHDVTVASTAEQALDRLHEERYQLLITDYRLPGATGTWLAGMALRHCRLAASQILVITAYDELCDAECFEVLHKPFSFDRFLFTIEHALEVPADPRPGTEPAHRVALVLYVNGAQAASVRALRRLRALLDRYPEEQIALMVEDISRRTDHHAEEDRVLATPTLVRTFPAPRVWVTGDLQRLAAVERLLEEAGVESRPRGIDGRDPLPAALHSS